MRKQFLGDTLDIVKRSILFCLSTMGPWTVCPMFTDNFTDDDVDTYEKLIGASTFTRDVISINYRNRNDYFAPYKICKSNLFIDPDTGIKADEGRRGHNKFIYGDELLELIDNRTNYLTLVFDQSYSNDNKPTNIDPGAIKKKLDNIMTNDVYYCAYVSHAIFILFGKDLTLIEKTLTVWREKSNLPRSRFYKSHST